MTDLTRLATANAARWARMTINKDRLAVADATAKRVLAGKARYQAVEAKTGVPWWVIGVIHYREADLNWDTHLSNGDPLHEVTRHVPAGEPAFATWEEGAVDALVNEPPHAARWRDWSIGGALTLLEQYNGLGYAERGVPSPYVFGATSVYSRGKYVADHDYDPNACDTQLGCAAILKRMQVRDPSITFGTAPPPGKTAPPKKSTKHHVGAGIGAAAGAGAAAHQVGLPPGAVIGLIIAAGLIAFIVSKLKG